MVFCHLMNCQIVITGTIPIVIFLAIFHYLFSVYQNRKLVKKIRATIPNVWSSYGGGNQTTEIAVLASLLVNKLFSNPNIISSFGLASLILTAVVSTIYSLNGINPVICGN